MLFRGGNDREVGGRREAWSTVGEQLDVEAEEDEVCDDEQRDAPWHHLKEKSK